IVGAQQNRRLPIKTVRAIAQFVFRLNVNRLSPISVQSIIISKLKTCVNNVAISVINLNLHAIASKDKFVWIFSLLQPTWIGFIIVRANPNAIVLQTAVNIVIFFVIYVYSVKLSN